jgi:hypothetical protein
MLTYSVYPWPLSWFKIEVTRLLKASYYLTRARRQVAPEANKVNNFPDNDNFTDC